MKPWRFPIDLKLHGLALNAKKIVIEQGFKEEIKWQESVDFFDIDETYFLKEAAWVILSSGMRESVIRNKFPQISHAFFDWKSANEIIINRSDCERDALLVFNNLNKINAIIKIAAVLVDEKFSVIHKKIKDEGVNFIRTFPYMGPATSYHFAKNIGLDVVKPDRHLVRVTEVWGYKTPHEMCLDISKESGDRISVVDIVIWRFATLCRDYIPYFRSYSFAV